MIQLFKHIAGKLQQKNDDQFVFTKYPLKEKIESKRGKYIIGLILDVACLVLIFAHGMQTNQKLLSPLISALPLSPIKTVKNSKEVFGFAPYWTFNNLDNVNFDVLTTMAYFGVPVNGDGSIATDDSGYLTFQSEQATNVFRKAHEHGTRVVLTVTQMHNSEIESLMDNTDAQHTAITTIVNMVQKRGIDGINIDMEYTGDPGPAYRAAFTQFVTNLTNKMHQTVPGSQVTVSVYASAIRDPKIYNIGTIAAHTDGIFMMAYDFAVAGSDNAIPTAPLHGYKEGKYWYDVATAVDDFLTVMPSNKLILGVPWYGYNYSVVSPTVKAETGPYYAATQTYAIAKDNLTPQKEGIDAYKTGWDSYGQVGWIAYHIQTTGAWRMIFLDDPKSLSLKYNFAKEKSLAGVGIWALGFDSGREEMWTALEKAFGEKSFADNRISQRTIQSYE